MTRVLRKSRETGSGPKIRSRGNGGYWAKGKSVTPSNSAGPKDGGLKDWGTFPSDGDSRSGSGERDTREYSATISRDESDWGEGIEMGEYEGRSS